MDGPFAGLTLTLLTNCMAYSLRPRLLPSIHLQVLTYVSCFVVILLVLGFDQLCAADRSCALDLYMSSQEMLSQFLRHLDWKVTKCLLGL